MQELPSRIDPVEFFAFLSGYDDFPTNGYKLAQAAKERGCTNDLAAFFEAMPGRFASEGDILPLAEEPSKPPWGSAVAIEPPANPSTPASADTDDLTISDVTQGRSRPGAGH